MNSDPNEIIRNAMIALRNEPHETRFIRLIAARRQGRSGCNRQYILLGHYDRGGIMAQAKSLYKKSKKYKKST